MKKFFAVLGATILSVFLSACTSDRSSVITYRDESGNFFIETSSDRTAMIDAIPYELKYNDSNISLVDVSLYENRTNFSYNLFLVCTIDVSNLDEEQVHWLKESDLNVRAFITNESNDYDFYSARYLGSLHYTDTNKIMYVFTSSFSEENRVSFSGSDISVAIDVAQNADESPAECLQYSFSAADSLPPPEEIEQPLQDHIADWLQTRANSLY